jgi:hypothetical protein
MPTPMTEQQLRQLLHPSPFRWTDQLTSELRELIRANSQSSENALANTISSWLVGKLLNHVLQPLLTAVENSEISKDDLLQLVTSSSFATGGSVTPNAMRLSDRELMMPARSAMALPQDHKLSATREPA